MPDAIGESGVSEAFNETDLGGTTLRFEDHDRAMTPFERRVLTIVSRIPVGRVTDLRRHREAGGQPGAARAVGNIMRRGDRPGCPTIASSPPAERSAATRALPLKRSLLAAEGLTVTLGGWSASRSGGNPPRSLGTRWRAAEGPHCGRAERTARRRIRTISSSGTSVDGRVVTHRLLATAHPSQPPPDMAPSNPTGDVKSADLELVGRIRSGDGAAFETLYRQHATRLYNLASRMIGRAR